MIGAAVVCALFSCTNLEVTMPHGPRGEQGIQGLPGKDGADGLSSYAEWKAYIASGTVEDPQRPGTKWDPSRNSLQDYFLFLTGPQGDDGSTPYIGENGNWWVVSAGAPTDLGVPARGESGRDGASAYEIWLHQIASGAISYSGGTDVVAFLKYLEGRDGKDGRDGTDGLTPRIGDNGNWWIGDQDTGVAAKGRDGVDGRDGKDGVDGKDGESISVTGRSAYELWVEAVLSDEGLPNPGNGAFDPETYPKWPEDAVSLDDFWRYLQGAEGKTGRTGADGKDGRDGKDGKNGLSAYEVWVELIHGGQVDHPQEPGEKWPATEDGYQDYFRFLTGAKGDDGNTPYVGANGNWWIGDEDSGVPARGRDGRDGADGQPGADGQDGADGQPGADGQTPHIGDNGNWWIGSTDTGIPARGRDGADGQDGQDGQDGVAGSSAYDIWKAAVLSAEGLPNPGNGVYDPDLWPNWPADAVSLSDFWDYLRGADGADGKDGADGQDIQQVHVYNEEVDPGKYNLAPVRALKRVTLDASGTGTETTYEYVNPYSGANCAVTFSSVTGKTYSKTSDDEAYIYLTREELEDYHDGDPSAETPLKPASFTFGGRTVSDPSKIAATCRVPYRVRFSIDISSVTLLSDRVVAHLTLHRFVEGKEVILKAKTSGGSTSLSWPGKAVYDGTKYGFSYYRGAGDVDYLKTLDKSADPEVISVSASDARYRPIVTDGEESTTFFHPSFGNGISPVTVRVHETFVNGAGTYTPPLADYGLLKSASEQVHLPELRRMEGFDFQSSTGSSSLVVDGKPYEILDPTGTPVEVNTANLHVILGETTLSIRPRYEDFGQCYRQGDGILQEGVYRFVRYASLQEAKADGALSSGSKVGLVYARGKKDGNMLYSTASLPFDATKELDDPTNGLTTIKNVYNGFRVGFSRTFTRNSSAAYYDYSVSDVGVTIGSVSYAHQWGELQYDAQADPYRASLSLGGGDYPVQVILETVSRPLAEE